MSDRQLQTERYCQAKTERDSEAETCINDKVIETDKKIKGDRQADIPTERQAKIDRQRQTVKDRQPKTDKDKCR